MVALPTRTARALGDGLGLGLGPSGDGAGLDGSGDDGADDGAGDDGTREPLGGGLDGPSAVQEVGAEAVASGEGSGPWALATDAAMARRAGTSTSPPLEIGRQDMIGVPPDVVSPGWRRYR